MNANITLDYVVPNEACVMVNVICEAEEKVTLNVSKFLLTGSMKFLIPTTIYYIPSEDQKVRFDSGHTFSCLIKI